jgi:hypothetical protein
LAAKKEEAQAKKKEEEDERKAQEDAEAAEDAAADEAGEPRKVRPAKPAATKPETEEELAVKEKMQELENKKVMEQRLVDALNKKSVQYCVTFDTCGQARRFTSAELETMQSLCRELRNALIRIDRDLFRAERKVRTLFEQKAALLPQKTAEERADEISDLAKLMEEKAGASVDKELVAYKHRQSVLSKLQDHIVDFKTYNCFKGPLPVLHCLFLMLGYKQQELADTDGVPQWSLIKKKLNDALFTKIAEYNPRMPTLKDKKKGEKVPAHLTIKALQEMVKPFTFDGLKERNYPLAEVLGFVKDALRLKKVTRKQIKAAKDEEKRLKTELEEKEKADAAAAAAGAGGDGADGADE